jgi:hypothetical protein
MTARARGGKSRETLEKRLDKTPSNARCFTQGFRVGEREWLLLAGDRERSLSLGSLVLLW